MDDNGALVERVEYDESGTPRVTSPSGSEWPASSLGNELYFQSRHYDAATGLYNNRARWYSPRLGRFLSSAPLGPVDGVNTYAYALNDPVNFNDPSGTVGCAIIGGLIGGFAGAAINNLLDEDSDQTFDLVSGAAGAVTGCAGPAAGNAVLTAFGIRVGTTGSRLIAARVLSTGASIFSAGVSGEIAARAVAGQSITAEALGQSVLLEGAFRGAGSALSGVFRGGAAALGASRFRRGESARAVINRFVEAGPGTRRGVLGGELDVIRELRVSAGGTGAKANASRSELRFAALFLKRGINVTFQRPRGRRSQGGRTADLILGGEAGTGVGGVPFDALAPTTPIADNVFAGIRKKGNQASLIGVDLTSTSVNRADLRDVVKRLKGSDAFNIDGVFFLE